MCLFYELFYSVVHNSREICLFYELFYSVVHNSRAMCLFYELFYSVEHNSQDGPFGELGEGLFDDMRMREREKKK